MEVTDLNVKTVFWTLKIQCNSFIGLCLGPIQTDHFKVNHVKKGQFYKGIIGK